ncbi:MAG TPA: hypothetical protein PKZ41_03100 [Candidatus Omnitrophota bacterium]|nr:hypothetical protein [Candidatus Omnitrophota bacterium]
MRKKIISVVIFVLVAGFSFRASASPLIDLRTEVIEEGKRIKSAFKGSKDIILLSSMWDACMITGVQLDAYFAMVGVVGTIKEEDLTPVSVEYLISWLGRVKDNNLVNIKNLSGIANAERDTKAQIKRVVEYYAKLNSQIDAEIKGLQALKTSLGG